MLMADDSLIRLAEQMSGGEPAHRIDVNPDGLLCLVLSGQVQPKRADVRRERSCIQLLRCLSLPPGSKDSFILFPELRHKKPVGNVAFDAI
jgi:hypothetical protein